MMPAVAADDGHKVDGERPTYSSATTSTDGATITVTFSENVMVPPLLTALTTATGLSSAQFLAAVMDVHVADEETYVSNAVISGATITLTLEDAVAQGQTVTVAYDNIFAADAPGLIIDGAGNALSTFTAQTVTNASTVTATDDGDDLVVSVKHVSVTEGSTATFTVELEAAPTGDVTVAIAPEQTNTKLTVSDSSLTFTTVNWNNAQTVTLTGVQDDDALSYWVVLELTASGGGYDAEAHVRVLIADDDSS